MTTDDLQSLARALGERDEPYAVVTVVRTVAPTSAYVGAQALVRSDGTMHGWIGGGCARNVVIGAARATLATGRPKLVRISNDTAVFEEDVEQYAMACASDGSIELFIQPYSARSAFCVLGETPAAEEARFLAERLGLRLTADPATAPIVLVATQGQGDEEALESALRGSAVHVLMIASRRKAERLRAAMRLRGLDDACLARFQAPAGPDAGAKTPAEIALVAMVGVLALVRGRGQATSSVDQARAAPAPEVSDGTTAINPVCGTVVRIQTARHVEVYAGRSFYFCCDGCLATFRTNPQKYAAFDTSTPLVEA